jgi:hypothetical protein
MKRISIVIVIALLVSSLTAGIYNNENVVEASTSKSTQVKEINLKYPV